MIFLVVCLSAMFAAHTNAQADYDNMNFDDQWYESSKETDRIISLPGVEPPSFEMFSGYLDVDQDHLFYWLMRSQNPSSRTLILWFNGGPGCSSMDGLFYEHGPFMFDDNTGELVENPNSWNKLAHVIYLESPVKTGFSYTTSQNASISDDTVATTNLLALKQFFLKFPEYRNFDFYITGESYAGIYIPLLTKAIIEDDGDIKDNLQGILIGNGLLNKHLNQETNVKYAYYHGLLSPKNYHEIQRLCKEKDSYACLEKLMEFKTELQSFKDGSGINNYNYAKDCAYYPQEDEWLDTRRKLLLSDSFGNLQLVPPCSNATFISRYLNRADVQESLHARLVGNTTHWQICSEELYQEYDQQYHDISSVFKEIMREKPFMKIVLFFGDLDLACNFIGGEEFADQLGHPVTTSRRKWTVERNGREQLAGFYKEYDNLMFIQFKAAGHMVPMDKPVEAFEMLRRVLNDEPL